MINRRVHTPRLLWVKSVALCNGRLRLDFRYTLLATKLARRCKMLRWAKSCRKQVQQSAC